jgi:3-hydroxybutyryl-CoA dehydrogenase
VLAGLLGRKSGRGFHRYDAQAAGDSTTAAEVAAADAVPRPGRVGIVGSGTMAAGIAEVFAASGWTAVLIGRSKDRALAAVDAVAASLDRAVRHGRATEAQRSAVLDRLAPGEDPELLVECDLVVEAVAEELDAKKAVFRTLGRVCRAGALLATTTSSLPVIECALASGRPEDVVGLHFFNPAPLMRLVEVVPSLQTAPERTDLAHRICRQLGKHPVRCGDRPGFLVNALLFPYLNEAVRMVESHYADAEAVDTVMRLGCGYPKGPLELLDIIGLDVSLSIQRTLHEAQGLPYSAPAPLLGHLVTAGRAGRKAGAGFRIHTR